MENDRLLPAIQAMEEHTGTVPGYRRAHARGIGFRAEFTPAARVGELTTAEHLQGPPVPAVVRLSNAAGSPYTPDRRPGHTGVTLGLGVRFALASGGHSTWAAASIPAFPARNPDDFVRITSAQRPTGPNPLKLLSYVARRRYALPALKGIAGLKPPASFATTRFNGLHAYFLVAPDGTRRAFRYSWIPEAGIVELGAKAEREWPPQYLISEIKQRRDAAWSLVFTLAAPEDPTDDVTAAWPADRETVTAGTLRLQAPHEDQDEVERTVFDPTGVVPGIELSDDPILHFRSAVYGESYRRRTSEERPAIRPE